jgi:hypothetical protein
MAGFIESGLFSMLVVFMNFDTIIALAASRSFADFGEDRLFPEFCIR